MLSARGLHVEVENRAILRGVDLDVGRQEIVALLGPSGSGKTTLLRAIAGLVPLRTGELRWGDEDLRAVAPHKRGFAMMFQDHALFPHRDVIGNVEFGLRMAGMARPQRRAKSEAVLALVGLGGYENRQISTLSGGEQQRVALARALAPDPRLLMLDEPLGSLDRVLRDRLRDELSAVLRGTGVPAIIVTHDHDEAFALADRVVILRDGLVAQAGKPKEVWHAPIDEWVARFVGHDAAADANVADGVVETPWGRFPVGGVPNGSARVVLRADTFTPDVTGNLAGEVLTVTFRGERTMASLRVGDGPPVRVEVEADTAAGDMVKLHLNPDAFLIYPNPRGVAPQP